MMKLTKERLTEIVRAIDSEAYDEAEIMGWFNSDDIIAMASQLLAGMEREPVAYIAKYESGAIHGTCDRDDPVKMEWLKRGMAVSPLYAAPQLPQPAVPDEILTRIEHEANHVTAWHHIDEHSCKVNRRDLLTLVNACRAAMLQGAEPPAYEIKGFGMFNATSLDLEGRNLATSIQCFHFERGTVPEHVFNQGIVAKHALQAIINALQMECDGMDDAPVQQIWPAAPQQEVKP